MLLCRIRTQSPNHPITKTATTKATNNKGMASKSTLAAKAAGRLLSTQALHKYASFCLNPQTLKTVCDFGTRPDEETYLQSCQFIHTEASIRLAHMIQEFRVLPKQHLIEPNISKVHDWYVESFDEMASIRTERLDFTEKISATVNKILQRHSGVVMTTSRGIINLRENGKMKDEIGMNEFLDRFFMSRIAIRFLFNQHLQVFKPFIKKNSKESNKNSVAIAHDKTDRWVGSIDRHCNVAAVATHAAESARMLCEEKYSDSPEVQIVHEHTVDGPHFAKVVTTCVPSHLYHIIFEMLKNSCRAVAEYHENSPSLPPIQVYITKGKEDLSIRISDRGGGIPQREMSDIFSYHYSTAETPMSHEMMYHSDMNHAPMAGFGYGIPVSRLYARYFGGDLSISSMEGYGTDCYVHLRANPLEATEVLPSASVAELSYASGLDRPTQRTWGGFYPRSKAM